MAAATRQRPANGHAPETGKEPLGDVDQALAYEHQLADEAEKIRDGATVLTADLFMQLVPLLKRPIPTGFISHTGVVKGKPYESTGVKSVQVLIDRMDNVLGPTNWRDRADFNDDGTLCEVTVEVLGPDREILLSRSSFGGVNQASTTGNRYKGSYTNAAKLAFARVGPGHEVYLGAVDFDPDVNEVMAEQQDPRPQQRATAPRAQSDVPLEDPDRELAQLLADGPLAEKRRKANDGMEILGAGPGQRLRELRACPDERSLDALISRINAALDTAAAA